MELVTPAFAYLFLGAVTGAWALRRHRSLRNAFLVTAAVAFLWRWHLGAMAAVLASTAVNYLAGELMFRRRRRAVLVAALVANVAFLGFFKYAGFFLDSLADLLAAVGLPAELPLLQLAAPLGISFYTFQGIAYVVDVHRGTAVRPRSFLDFLLFMTFFLKLAAGPICRSHELLPQIHADPPERIAHSSRAVALIALGLLKKWILATYLAVHRVDDVFLHPSHASAAELWAVAFGYTAQIYLDFSGYTDIARGCALLLGFELPENFRWPYAAASIGEYWRRWHMTFSRWLRDYIYFPLGGSRRGRARTYANLIVTFLICGLWHGAAWGYVVWGGLHGAALIVDKALRDRRRARGLPPEKDPPATVWGFLATFTFCVLARIWFKTRDLDGAWAYLAGLFDWDRPGTPVDTGVLFIVALTVAENFAGPRVVDAFVRWHQRLSFAVRPLVWLAIGALLLAVRPHEVALTIYFGF